MEKLQNARTVYKTKVQGFGGFPSQTSSVHISHILVNSYQIEIKLISLESAFQWLHLDIQQNYLWGQLSS